MAIGAEKSSRGFVRVLERSIVLSVSKRDTTSSFVRVPLLHDRWFAYHRTLRVHLRWGSIWLHPYPAAIPLYRWQV